MSAMNGLEIADAPTTAVLPQGYRITEKGILRRNKHTGNWEVLCATPILLRSQLRNVETNEQLLEIVFRPAHTSCWKSLVVPSATLFKAQGLTKLANYGISVGSANAVDLARFLRKLYEENMFYIPMKKAMSHMGWWETNFVPGAEGDLTVIPPHGTERLVDAYSQSGSLEEWVGGIETYREVPIFRFLLSASFAAPLLHVLRQPTFIIHSCGRTRSGKTAAVEAALSVWGFPGELLTSFYTTKIGLTRLLMFHHNLPVGVDERKTLGAGDKVLFAIIMLMLSEQIIEHRSNSAGDMQSQRRWNTIIFTTGEDPIVEAISKFGNTGSRIIEINGSPCKSEMDASDLYDFIGKQYGTAGQVYIKKLVELIQDDPKFINNQYKDFKKQLFAEFFSTEVSSQIPYIATVAVGDFLSSQWIFGATEEEAKQEALNVSRDIVSLIIGSGKSDKD